MKKTIKQLKSDKGYLLMIIRLFDGRENFLDMMICKQYRKQLEKLNKEIENFEA